MKTNFAKLCVATTWEDSLIDSLVEISSQREHGIIYEIFGAPPKGFVGSGREASAVPVVTIDNIRQHVSYAKSKGIHFNYLLNASCLGNREFTKPGHEALFESLEFVQSLGCEWVTVSVPFLVSVIKKEFPSLKVNVSTISHVDSIPKAKFWESLGADRITLSYMINRDFRLLSSLVNQLTIGLEVLANESCLYECPLRTYHYNLVAHSSQDKSLPIVQYPFFSCTYRKLQFPSEFLKARWIRPEDVQYYVDIGIPYIKLAGREKTSDWIIQCAQAYISQISPNNLAEIIALIMPNTSEFIDQPSCPPQIYIDNTKLSGFLDHFKKSGIRCEVDCGTHCQYCDRLSEESVRIEPSDIVHTYREALKNCLDTISSSKLRQYLGQCH